MTSPGTTEAIGEGALRLLVVDDDEVDRLIVRRALRSAGIAAELFEAHSVASALSMLAERRFDCVLLDFNLPGGDGMRVLRAARGAGIDTPVIMLTGRGDEETAVELMKAGASDYVVKGALTPERLAQGVRHAIALYDAQRDTARAQAELAETAERQRFLAEASRALASALDIESALQTVARRSAPMLGDRCAICLVSESGELRPIATAEADEPDALLAAMIARIVRRSSPDARSAAEDALADGNARLVELSPDERTAAPPSVALVQPLIARGIARGVMCFLRSPARANWSAAELALADDLARRAAVAIDNARLLEQARQANDALRRKSEEAERARGIADEANRAKSQFLAAMSHDLRTPLNAIGGYVQLIDIGVHGPVTAAQSDALARVRRAQEHLLSLINDILNFATLEAGKLPLDLMNVPIEELVAGLEVLAEPQLAAKGVRYANRGGPAGLIVRADRERALQILVNVLSNAAKFTDAGGLVEVAWTRKENTVHIHVRDSGRGIPADKIRSIFDPFVQLDLAQTSARSGVGLGLAISRGLARAMGGDLVAESELGVGSTFTLALPGTAPADQYADSALHDCSGEQQR